jgi:serine/threonine protein kinase
MTDERYIFQADFTAGQGTYGHVVSARSRSGNQYAVKCNFIDRSTSFCGSLKEADILKKINGHPYCVLTKDIINYCPFAPGTICVKNKGNERVDKLYFIFEFMPKNLTEFIHSQMEDKIYFHLARVYLAQILLSLEHIHSKGIIHRDLKPDNILWSMDSGDQCGLVKICDFGLSRPMENQGNQTPKVVTCLYRAPEICAGDSEYTSKIDLWSTGMIFYEMLCKSPFLKAIRQDHDLTILDLLWKTFPSQQTSDLMVRWRIRSLTLGPVVVGSKPQYPYHVTHGLNTMLPQVHSMNPTQYRPTPAMAPNSMDQSMRELDDIKATITLPSGSSIRSEESFNDALSLLLGLLRLDHRKRLSATEALNHPFFDKIRSFIDGTRARYPVRTLPIGSKPLRIICSRERMRGCLMAHTLFIKREGKVWYRHRILFTSLYIFDCYLSALRDRSENKSPNTISLAYLVSLYMSIKYHMTMMSPPRFEDVAALYQGIQVDLVEAEKIEDFILSQVMEYHIYHETIYEVADSKGMKLSDDRVGDLLEFYMSSLVERHDNTGCVQLTPAQMYELFCKTHPIK